MLRTVLVLTFLAATALAAPVPKENDAARLARTYGTPYEFTKPDQYALDGGKLRIFVAARGAAPPRPEPPGALAGAGLTPVPDSPVGAPRVWRDVTGDFTLTAKVSLAHDSDRARKNDRRVAGLLAWAETDNFIALTRAGTAGVGLLFIHPGGVRSGSASPGRACEDLYLRLRRAGATVTSGYSADGKTWEDFVPDEVEWGATVKVGLYVKERPDLTYEAVFDEYTLTVPKAEARKGPAP